MIGFITLSYICGVATLIDMYRRPYASWEYADRDRGYWGMFGGFCTLIAVGIFFGLAYLMLVVRRFPSQGGTAPETGVGRNDFKK